MNGEGDMAALVATEEKDLDFGRVYEDCVLPILQKRLGRTLTVHESLRDAFEEALLEVSKLLGEGKPVVCGKMKQWILSCVRELVEPIVQNDARKDSEKGDLGPRDESIYLLAHRLGVAYFTENKQEDAETCLLFSLRGLTKEEDPHPQLLAICQSLAAVHEKSGDLPKAIALNFRILQLQEKEGGKGSRLALNTKSSLAGILLHAGDLSQSNELFRDALAGLISLEKGHLDVAMCMGNYAVALERLGKVDLAISYYKQALRTKEKILGADNVETLRTLSNFAMLLEASGEIEAAEEMYERCVKGKSKYLGPKHIESLEAKGNLAGCVMRKISSTGASASDIEQAVQTLRDIFHALEETAGRAASATTKALADLAFAELQFEHLQEAVDLFQDLVERQEGALGENHILTLKSRFNFGLALLQSEKNEEGKEQLLQCLQGNKSSGNAIEVRKIEGILSQLE